MFCLFLYIWRKCSNRNYNFSNASPWQVTVEGFHYSICLIMSIWICLDVGRGNWGQEIPEGALRYLRERERQERVYHTGHKKTPTTRESPFIVHNTSLFILFSKSVHLVYSKSIATEALDKGLQNRDICRLVFNPSHHIQTGEGKRKEAGYIDRERQYCCDLMYYRTLTVWASQG